MSHMTLRACSTSGSPLSWLVWIRIFPRRMSLQTAIRACSMVSPALRMDTPVIYTHTHAHTNTCWLNCRPGNRTVELQQLTPSRLMVPLPTSRESSSALQTDLLFSHSASCRYKHHPEASPRIQTDERKKENNTVKREI